MGTEKLLIVITNR